MKLIETLLFYFAYTIKTDNLFKLSTGVFLSDNRHDIELKYNFTCIV